MPSGQLWKSLNITKASLIDSQGGKATRNIDGVVYDISYDAAADSILVIDRRCDCKQSLSLVMCVYVWPC